MTQEPALSRRYSTTRILPALTLLFALFGTLSLPAEQFGLFTYQITPENTVTITDYRNNAVGEVAIPEEIDGKPVSSIGWWAFSSRTGLISFHVAPLNSNYSSEDGVLFDEDKTTLILCPAGKSDRQRGDLEAVDHYPLSRLRW